MLPNERAGANLIEMGTQMNQVKRNVAKTAGYSLLSVALASATFVPAVAIAVESGESVLPSDGSTTAKESKGQPTSVQAPSSKDETVYVHTTADGSVKSEEVSVTLKNPGSADALSDTSNLEGIQAEDGDGVYSGDRSDMVWSANGQDVTYKGSSDAEAPIDVRVTYKLDGKAVTPEELAGKSGRVSIRYDYVNKSKATVDVNGVSQEVFTPFVAVTAMLLDEDVFSNVSVTNARIVEDGKRTIVIGYAMPGLEESLNLSDGGPDIPSYFELEADVKDFSLKSSLTMASPNLLDDVNFDFDTSELSSASESLKSAMSQIVSGSGEFADAVEKISEAAGAMSAGTKELAVQTSGLPGSVGQIAQGAQALSTGIAQLQGAVKEVDASLRAVISGSGSQTPQSAGLTGAVENVSLLKEQAKQLYESLSGQSADDALQGQSAESPEHLSQLAAQVSAEASDLQGNVQGIKDAAGQAASSAAQSQADVSAAQSTLQSIDLNAIEDPAVRAQIQAQLDAANAELAAAGASAQAASDGAQALQSASGSVDASAAAEAAGVFANAAAGGSLSAQSEGATVTREQIEAAKRLYLGLSALEGGLTQAVQALNDIEQKGLSGGILAPTQLPALANGAAQLAQGASQLSGSAPALVNGIGQVSSGSADLANALGALATAARELAGGLAQFNDEGIVQFANALDDKLAKPASRFDAVAKAGREYQSFSGKGEGVKGSVKFVYETDPIEAS